VSGGRLTGLLREPLLRGTRSRIPSPAPTGEALFGVPGGESGVLRRLADLEAIEEECGGAHDLQLVIEVLLEIIRKLESSR
jgi:hypothetical protein